MIPPFATLRNTGRSLLFRHVSENSPLRTKLTWAPVSTKKSATTSFRPHITCTFKCGVPRRYLHESTPLSYPKNQFPYPGVLEVLNYVNFLNLSFLGHITRKIRLFVLFSPFYSYGSIGTFVRMQGVSYLFPYERVPFRTGGLLRKGYDYPPFVPLS